MKENRSAYRQIMKATSLFGGVQVFNILISIARSKFVAVFLGPSGMGIIGLFTSTLSLIVGITSFGLATSAVKDVSAANNSKDNKQIALVITVLRRLVWITGIIGCLATIILSSWLSQITFGNSNYTLAFIWLSISLLFTQLSNGQLVVLQGMRKLKHLAKANLLGSALGLFAAIPLYYFLGLDGIVPVIIGTSFFTLILSWFYARKIKIEPVAVTLDQTFSIGKDMLSMGFMISLGGLLSTLGAYLIRVFISQTGGVEQVGLYTAGFAIINMYLGLVLRGMGTDYYPRLSAVASDAELFKQTINKQAEIGILIIAPLLITFMVFVNWVIQLLYTKEFIVINTMLVWTALGMFFRVPSWCLGFVFLAKSESALYFYLQLFSHSLLLGLNIGGYYFMGLTGLGISILFVYPTYLLVVYTINNKKFDFSFDHSAMNIFVFQFVLALIVLITTFTLGHPYLHIIGVMAIILSCWHSLMHLDERLGLRSALKKFVSAKK